MLTDKNASRVVATQVPEGEPLQEALSAHFGKYVRHFEEAVLCFARLLSPASGSHTWCYFELSNGGFYMRPAHGLVEIDAPGFNAHVSAEVFGVVATLRALEFLYAETREPCMTHHHLLLGLLITRHPEGRAINDSLLARV